MYLPFKKFAKDMKTASGSIFPITLMEKDLESLPMRTQDPGPTLKKGPVREDLPTRYLGAFLMGMLLIFFFFFLIIKFLSFQTLRYLQIQKLYI